MAIIGVYFLATVLIGLWGSRRGAKDFNSYVLGSRSLPWYVLGISEASGMFDTGEHRDCRRLPILIHFKGTMFVVLHERRLVL